MVARILSCAHYTGGDYPAVISPELHRVAHALKEDAGKNAKGDTLLKTLRSFAACACCGRPLVWNGTGSRKRWRCPTCFSSGQSLTTKLICEALSAILLQLTRNPGIVQSSPRPKEAPMEQNPCDFPETHPFDPICAREQALAHTAAQFAALDMSDYETERIRHLIIQNENTSTEPDKLLNKIAAAILIHPTGTVSLKLRNGQIIESKEGGLQSD